MTRAIADAGEEARLQKARRQGAVAASIEASKLNVLRIICWLLVAGPSLFLALFFFLLPEHYRQAAGPVLILLLAGICLVLIRLRHEWAAANLLVYGGWLAIAAHTYVSGNGIHTPQLAALPLGIVLSGWLLGARHAIAVTTLSIGLGFALLLFPDGTASLPPLLILLPRTVVAVGVCVLTLYIVRTYEDKLTEVRHLGEALAEEKNQLREIAENVPALIFHGDRNQRCLYANRQMADFFHGGGVSVEGMCLREILGTVAYEAALPNINRTLAGESVHMEAERRSKSGDLRRLEISLVPQHDLSGAVIGFYALKRDVTERLRTEEALAEREHQLRIILDNVPAMICYSDSANFVRYANKNFLDLLGLNATAVIGKTFAEVIGKQDFHQIEPYVRRTLGGEPATYRANLHRLTGEERQTEVDTVPDRGPDGAVRGVYALIRDITDQARAEEKFAKIFNATPLPAVITRADTGCFIDINDAAIRFGGWRREEVIGRTAPELGLWADPQERSRALAVLMTTGHLRDFESTSRTRAGELRSTLISAEPIDLEGARCILTTIYDITERKRIEEELHRSEQKFSRVFHSSPTAISLTRMVDGRFADVNEAWIRIFGWTRTQVVGRNSLELGIWPNPERRQAWIEAVNRVGRVENFEARLRDKSGRILSILLSSEVVELDGEPCLLALSIDQTKQKKTEAALLESERRLSEAQRMAHIGSWELDLTRDVFVWTGEIENIYEIHAEQGTVTYADFLKTLPPDEREEFNRCFGEGIRAGRGGEFTYRSRMRDGRIKHLHVRYESRLGDDGKPARIFGTTQDITEQVLAREEVQRLNDELERRVQERTAELLSANRELESFAYSISHDLRAPLRGIDGFSHLLAEEYAERLDETGRDYLERVRRAAQRMGTLIDDILELSRVTRQEMRRVRVDLSQIAAEIFEERARVEPGRKVEVSIAHDCIALGDPQLLRVLMQNLLENAWKYSRKADPARIAFGQEVIDGETVFHVSDNGVGFDMKYAERLFAPFQRLHRPDEFEGTGIGLATVARVVHRHGGRVWADASPGRGATFRFTLPVVSGPPRQDG